ncbi:hypothetical protein [Streptomyces sp. NBC_00111]|uniref:hypothetical protein n=1 Tax=Streptomyces sp. NBC_00111 TaxID=2975655 RepID=UPI0038657C7C
MPRTHLAVEQDRLEELRDLLAAGADIHEESNGFTLLHRAVDGEIGGHVQTGEPLHVDATCFLLSQGADPHVVHTAAPECQPIIRPSQQASACRRSLRSLAHPQGHQKRSLKDGAWSPEAGQGGPSYITVQSAACPVSPERAGHTRNHAATATTCHIIPP